MIPGFFARNILPQPLVEIVADVDGLQPDWVPIPFVVDTGAAFTCIHARDAIRKFGMSAESLDPDNWPPSDPVHGISGSLRYRTFPARLAFQRDDGGWEVVDAPIRIGELKSESTPSLLGCDVLKFFNLEVDVGNQIVRLRRVPQTLTSD
ncbi:MAG: hypothetical protein ABIQ47_08140 [Tepidiformaceae bacterium]